jgi:hypothetical protein
MDSAPDEKRLADALEFGCRDPEFKATMLRKILYFTGEEARMAILVLSLEEMGTKIEELRRQLEAERSLKWVVAAASPARQGESG